MICEGGRYLPWLTARFQRVRHAVLAGHAVRAATVAEPKLSACKCSHKAGPHLPLFHVTYLLHAMFGIL